MDLHFLGTAGGVPSPDRGLPCTALRRDGRTLLFDCGEGTQRQLMTSQLSLMSVDVILLSHHHGDHVTGLPGLIQTMSLFSRDAALTVMGPNGTTSLVQGMLALHDDVPRFKVEVRDLQAGEAFSVLGMTGVAVQTCHTVPSLGYVLREPERPGRFDAGAADWLGVPDGPLRSTLVQGRSVSVNGEVVMPEQVTGPRRPGRSVAYSGDTLPCREFIEAADDVDVMIHEATFNEELVDKAATTGHSTARQAAEAARDAGAHILVLTHISPRVEDEAIVYKEAAGVENAPRTVVARDFDSLRIEHRC